jgi:hypothetical protein
MEMSFIRSMKDKKNPKPNGNVLHKVDEGQKGSSAQWKCPS